MKRVLKTAPFAALSLLMFATPSAQALDACNAYANTAVSQQRNNVQNRCALDGLRWHSDRHAHKSYCHLVGPDIAGIETRERDHQLNQCLAQGNNNNVPAPQPLPYGPDTCKPGFVWRDAIPGDHVCVKPNRRTKAAKENAIAGSRVDPAGAYGPNSCKVGFVWRSAYSGDVVCVTAARRTQVRKENNQGPNNRVLP